MKNDIARHRLADQIWAWAVRLTGVCGIRARSLSISSGSLRITWADAFLIHFQRSAHSFSLAIFAAKHTSNVVSDSVRTQNATLPLQTHSNWARATHIH